MSVAANVAAVDAALFAVLTGDAALMALVPDGIWRDVAPAGSTRAVTIQFQAHEDIEGFRAPVYETFQYRIVVHILEKSGGDADAAAYRIHTLLQDTVLAPIAGYTHMATLRVEPIRTQDPDSGDNDLRWQLAGADYEITVSPD